MKSQIRKAFAGAFAAAAIAVVPFSASAAPVGLELVLMMDVSGSISTADFNTQRDGYRDAFLDPTVQNFIANTAGGVAVTLVQWSTGQNLTIPWALLTDGTSATAFANAINAMTRASSGSTGTTNALNYSAGLLASNSYEGARSVIDVSSDGFDNTSAGCADFNNTCVALQTARNAFLADTTHAINALWMADGTNYTTGTLLTYGTTNLVGGANSFQLAVTGAASFGSAITTKLRTEIGRVPEPTTLALLGLSLAALGALRRRVA